VRSKTELTIYHSPFTIDVSRFFIDHPFNAEFISEHSEVIAPRSFAQRNSNGAADKLLNSLSAISSLSGWRDKEKLLPAKKGPPIISR
jgi:hypothetical protein